MIFQFSLCLFMGKQFMWQSIISCHLMHYAKSSRGGIWQLVGSIPYLLMRMVTKVTSASAGTVLVVLDKWHVLLLILSTWVKPNPRYESNVNIPFIVFKTVEHVKELTVMRPRNPPSVQCEVLDTWKIANYLQISGHLWGSITGILIACQDQGLFIRGLFQ